MLFTPPGDDSEGVPLRLFMGSNNLFIFINESGEISRVWELPNYPHTIVKEILQREKNIFRLFTMPETDSLKTLMSKGLNRPFFLRQDLSREILSTQGYLTDMPFLILNIHTMAERSYFGRITLGKYIPNIYYTDHSIILYVDDRDRLRGFNNNLLRNLPEERADAVRKLLGEPVSALMDPTPASVQSRHIGKAVVPEGAWTTVWSKARFSLEDFRERSGGVSCTEGEPAVWSNDSGAVVHTRFPGTLDTRTKDFRFTVVCRVLRGDGPVLFTGSAAMLESDANTHSYEAGKTFHQTSFTIKRSGNALRRTPGETPRGISRFVFMRIGRVFRLSINGSIAVQYFDPELECDPDAAFQIMVRPGTSLELHSATLECMGTSAPPHPDGEADLVRLKTQPDKVYMLSRFYNSALDFTFGDVMGFGLMDVSDIERKASLYRQQYRREKERHEKLKSLYEGASAARAALVGAGKAMSSVRDRLVAVAGTTVSVLLQGATGTGKELAARFIHDQSGREGLFVKIDCSALPPTLIESELFGHEKGAFTGAFERKIGRFEQAQKGTIFLDEVGNLSRGIQAKLLNVLQDLAITRIGGSRAVSLDVRVIAATNVRLDALIRQGAFREDLFYRINTVVVDLPDLKDRKEDIPELCRYFLARFNANRNIPVRDLSAEAYLKLYNHDWPGNVRELRNILQNAVLFSTGEIISAEALHLDMRAPRMKIMRTPLRERYHLDGMTKEQWTALLSEHRGLVNRVAEALGATRATCYRNFKKHGLDPAVYRFR